MLHKLAIAVGALCAAAVIGVVLGSPNVTSGAPATRLADDSVSQIAVAPTPLTKTVTDNVYVKPTPKPRVIHIKKRVVAASHRQQVVTVVQSMRSGESDMSENERENGD